MKTENRIIVVLPAYNEEDAIGALLDRFIQLMKLHPEVDMRVAVINDGSTDSTPAVLDKYKKLMPLEVVNHPKNMGLGAAVRTCLREGLRRSSSDNDIIISMDADNTHLPEYIPALVQKIQEGADIAIASRFRRGSREVGVPFLRRVYSRGARLLFHIFLRLPNVRDYTCGYRAYRAGLIRRALDAYGDDIITRNGFACTDDLLVRLAFFTHRIEEVPFILRYDNKIGESKLPLFTTIMETLRLLVHRRPGGRK